jgi:hypothetical protein
MHTDLISFHTEDKKESALVMHNLIHGRTVSLVGPANYMLGSSHGAEIDDSDIVVRLNRGFDTCKNYTEDMGSRTDILYSCLIEKQANAGKINVDRLVEENIKIVCAPPYSDYEGKTYAHSSVVSPENPRGMILDTLHELVNKNTVKSIMDKGVRVRVVTSQLNELIRKQILCKPNTGFLSIYDLASFKPKRLKIFGISFYLDGFVPGEKTGVEEEQNCTEQEFADKAFTSKRHIQKNMWKTAKETLLTEPRIHLDPQLRKILEMDKFSRESYRALK